MKIRCCVDVIDVLRILAYAGNWGRCQCAPSCHAAKLIVSAIKVKALISMGPGRQDIRCAAVRQNRCGLKSQQWRMLVAKRSPLQHESIQPMRCSRRRSYLLKF